MCCDRIGYGEYEGCDMMGWDGSGWYGMGWDILDGMDVIGSNLMDGRDGWNGVVRICLDQMDMIRSDKIGWDEMSWMD